MWLSLTNGNDIIANSFSTIAANGAVADILDAVQSSVVGLPPASLNTIEQFSAAISNDPSYFQKIQTTISSTAPASTPYTKTVLDAALAFKSDISTTCSKTQINTFLDTSPDVSELVV